MVNTKPEKDTRYPLWVGPSIGLDGCKKSRPHRVYFVSSCTLYSIRTSFFVLIVLHFAFCLFLQHNTNIHAPGGIRNRYPSRQAATDHTLDRAATVIAMIRSPDRTFLSESLYRLHHPGPFKLFSTHGNCECSNAIPLDNGKKLQSLFRNNQRACIRLLQQPRVKLHTRTHLAASV